VKSLLIALMVISCAAADVVIVFDREYYKLFLITFIIAIILNGY
jgi:hypothetical protein